MEDFNSINLEDVFELVNNKNEEIKKTFDDIKRLKIKIDTNNIKKLSDVSESLNTANDLLKEIYYHLLNNDSSISKTVEEVDELRTFKIDNIIKKTFLPYMMLMKIQLENNM